MSELYDKTYNPDVLSCLANLSNDEVFTPPEVANQMLDMLPKEIWSDPDATFLDPACKSGVFLREIAKRLIKGLEDVYPDLDERLEHIFKKQLHGVAITELTSLLSRRSVYCSKYPNSKYSVVKFDTVEGNVRFHRCTHTWVGGKCKYCGASEEAYERDSSLETHAYEFIHQEDRKGMLPMKFDVVVGNPPYQLGNKYDNQQRDKPIYHYFVQQAKKLNPKHLCMIIPARWFTGTWNLGKFPQEMLHDHRIKELHDFPDAKECFPGVTLKGGVCYFHWDREYSGKCLVVSHSQGGISKAERFLLEDGSDVFIRSNEGISILEKVSAHGAEGFDSLVSSQNPFGFNTAYRGHEEREDGDILLIRVHRNGEFIKKNEVLSHQEWVNEWKVLIPKAGEGEALPNKVLGKPFIAGPGTCCTGTYMVIGPFNDKATCENVVSYIQTSLFRFLVSLKKITQDTKAGTYSFVPVQDFSRPWDDEHLYGLYGIDDEEREYIASQISPMSLDEALYEELK